MQARYQRSQSSPYQLKHLSPYNLSTYLPTNLATHLKIATFHSRPPNSPQRTLSDCDLSRWKRDLSAVANPVREADMECFSHNAPEGRAHLEGGDKHSWNEPKKREMLKKHLPWLIAIKFPHFFYIFRTKYSIPKRNLICFEGRSFELPLSGLSFGPNIT
jgi:hypothetical protein